MSWHVQPTSWLRASVSGLKGNQRETMEDRIVFRQWQSLNNQFWMFLVMDGHGGTNTARFVAAHFLPYWEKAWPVTRKVRACIAQVFRDLHEGTKNFDDGSTVTLLLFHQYKSHTPQTWVAHLGDSSVVGIRKSSSDDVIVQRLTRDHKVHLKRERARLPSDVEIKDGYIYDNGEGLNMTRALGDSALGRLLTREPDIRHLTNRWDVIVVASDGLWDVVNPKKLLDILREDNAEWQTSAARLNALRNRRWAQHDNTSLAIVLIDWR